jgi:hypothetical protein
LTCRSARLVANADAQLLGFPELRSQFASPGELDFSACEGVDAAPTPGDFEQGEHANAARKRRVDDEVFPHGHDPLSIRPVSLREQIWSSEGDTTSRRPPRGEAPGGTK